MKIKITKEKARTGMGLGTIAFIILFILKLIGQIDMHWFWVLTSWLWVPVTALFAGLLLILCFSIIVIGFVVILAALGLGK